MCGWLCLHAFRCNISRRSCGYKKDIKIETAIKVERKQQNIKDTPPCVLCQHPCINLYQISRHKLEFLHAVIKIPFIGRQMPKTDAESEIAITV
jgi:hypothetical protein